MGDRWWIMQLINAWNDVPASPGARTLGGKGDDFALVGPQWKGELPAGLSEIRSDTNLLLIGGRTYTAGKPTSLTFTRRRTATSSLRSPNGERNTRRPRTFP